MLARTLETAEPAENNVAEISHEDAYDLTALMQGASSFANDAVKVVTGTAEGWGLIHIVFPPIGPCLILRAALNKLRSLIPTPSTATIVQLAAGFMLFAVSIGALDGTAIDDVIAQYLSHHPVSIH